MTPITYRLTSGAFGTELADWLATESARATQAAAGPHSLPEDKAVLGAYGTALAAMSVKGDRATVAAGELESLRLALVDMTEESLRGRAWRTVAGAADLLAKVTEGRGGV